uniref:Uncharacterized protein n=1 Tax=Arundo donax TaxID=35708 RepID=A0A0A8XZD6_ARUDO
MRLVRFCFSKRMRTGAKWSTVLDLTAKANRVVYF